MFRDSMRQKTLRARSMARMHERQLAQSALSPGFPFPFLKIALTPSDTRRGIAHPLRAAFLLASLPPWRAP